MTTEPAAPRPARSPLEGELVRLRAVEHSDVEWVNAHFWNPNVTRFLEARLARVPAPAREAFLAGSARIQTVVRSS